MKVSQACIEFEGAATPLLMNVDFGQCCLYKGKLVMRVKPVNFITNSSLVTDVINRGKVFVVDIEKGTLFIADGETTISFVDSSTTWSKR